MQVYERRHVTYLLHKQHQLLVRKIQLNLKLTRQVCICMTDYTTFALKLDPGSDLQTVKKQMVGHISVGNILMQEWGNFACKCTLLILNISNVLKMKFCSTGNSFGNCVHLNSVTKNTPTMDF